MATEELHEFLDTYGKWMNDSRTHLNKDKDYIDQQVIYSNYAKNYDGLVQSPKHEKLAARVKSLFPNNKDINILDYCCGTGLVLDSLAAKGFTNIDGFDGNQTMLDVLERKQHTRKLICGRNTNGLGTIPDGYYDAICSCASFFVSSSHPGTECFKELCRIIKPGGYFVIIVKEDYVREPYVNWDIVEQLKRDGVLRLEEKEAFEGYREKFDFEDDVECMGIMYTYKVL